MTGSAPELPVWEVVDLGTEVPYQDGLVVQQERHLQVAQEAALEALYLLEHQRVITCGRNTQPGNVLLSEAELSRRGIALYASGRGGDVTYHGPGQLVGYPIVRLREAERDVRRYVFALEEALVRTVDAFGIRATRIEGLRGVWVGNDKLAAIGVRLSRWTTSHGFALNVTTQLSDFEAIVPCGLRGRGVTSMERLLGTAPPMDELKKPLVAHLGQLLNRTDASLGARVPHTKRNT